MNSDTVDFTTRVNRWLRAFPPHTDFFTVILVIAIGTAVLQSDAPLKWNLLPLLLAIFSLPLLRKTQTDSFLKCFPYVTIIFLVAITGYFVSSKYPIYDSYIYYFPTFQYIAESFAAGEGYPAWFPSAGGVRLGFSHINYGYALPYHLVGYVLYATTPVSLLLAYKISYVIGVLLIGLGWGLFLERLTKSALAAVVGAFAVMLGGSCITLHQEQVLVTLTWYPWLLLALYELKNDRRWLPVIAALAGILAVTHYPQIHFIAIALFILLIAATKPAAIRERLFLPGWGLLALSVIVFLMAASPLAYIVSHMADLASRHRPQFFPSDYETWVQINGPKGYASARPWYFRQYLDGIVGRFNFFTDSTGLFVGRITILLAAAGLLLQFRKLWPVAVLAAVYALLTMGIHSPVDLVSLLFHTVKPLVNLMREWFHFFPLVNLCLIVLAAYGVASGYPRLTAMYPGRQWILWLAGAAFMLLVYDLADYASRYARTYVRANPPAVVTGQFYDESHDPSLVSYRSRMQLDNASSDANCPNAIPAFPYLTSNVTPGISTPDGQIEQLVAACRNPGAGVVANIPASMLQTATPDALVKNSGHIDETLRYDGVDLNVSATGKALLVTAVNYDLGLIAAVDGVSAPVWRVNGALTGVLIGPGEHRVTLRVRRDSYTYALSAHLIASLAAVALILYLLRHGRQHGAGYRVTGSQAAPVTR